MAGTVQVIWTDLFLAGKEEFWGFETTNTTNQVTSLAHVRESLTILLREILTILLPLSPWHVVYFHMPSDTKELESRHSEVSLYPSTTGQFLLGCAGGRLLGAFLAGYSLQVVQKEALSAGRQAADLQAAPVNVGSCGSVVFPCVHPCITAAQSIPLQHSLQSSPLRLQQTQPGLSAEASFSFSFHCS